MSVHSATPFALPPPRVIASYRRSKSRDLSFFLGDRPREIGLTTSVSEPLPAEPRVSASPGPSDRFPNDFRNRQPRVVARRLTIVSLANNGVFEARMRNGTSGISLKGDFQAVGELSPRVFNEWPLVFFCLRAFPREALFL